MARPTLPEILTRVQNSIVRKLPSSNPQKRRGFLPALAYALSGASHEQHGHIEQQKKAMHPLFAKGEALRGWCALLGVPQIPGTQAAGSVLATGTDGSVIAAGEELVVNKIRFVTTAAATIASGTATIPVKAVEVGVAGNIVAGVKLTFIRALSGVRSVATVAADGITGGTDPANDDRLSDALQFHFQHPPGGGSDDDYQRWAREASSLVTNVWITKKEFHNASVSVRIMTYGTTATGIPDAEVIATVQSYIVKRAPGTADVHVLAPIGDPLDLVFSQLTPDTPAVRAAIAAELADLLIREAQPGGTLLLSHIDEAISLAEGETDHVLYVPATNIISASGHIPVPGSISIAT